MTSWRGLDVLAGRMIRAMKYEFRSDGKHGHLGIVQNAATCDM